MVKRIHADWHLVEEECKIVNPQYEIVDTQASKDNHLTGGIRKSK